MNLWTFLDRNPEVPVVALVALMFVGFATAAACSTGRKHEASGCGIHVEIGSSPKDGGAP